MTRKLIIENQKIIIIKIKIKLIRIVTHQNLYRLVRKREID